jgi:hypothetical protein
VLADAIADRFRDAFFISNCKWNAVRLCLAGGDALSESERNPVALSYI